uniref:Uncharacterized protein n=1 Tax=Anopheles albimanus TaxID=7167 RepID=A0A182FWP0_ANOAL
MRRAARAAESWQSLFTSSGWKYCPCCSFSASWDNCARKRTASSGRNGAEDPHSEFHLVADGILENRSWCSLNGAINMDGLFKKGVDANSLHFMFSIRHHTFAA